MINFLDYDRQQNQVPLKEFTWDSVLAQEELVKAWLRNNAEQNAKILEHDNDQHS